MKERYILEGREPFIVFKQFEDICSIPHGSGHEEALGDHVIAIAEEHGYSFVRDDTGNILIDVPASEGSENAPSLCIQGHLDMVLAKKPHVTKDLVNEPVDLIVEGDKLRADDTTLGADNAVGLCNMLAFMEEAENVPHPPVELLFTVSEETGLIGMKAFDTTLLKSRMLLNMDMGDPGLLEISSAGSSKSEFKQTFEEVTVPRTFYSYTFRIDDLTGGHSGIEAGKNRGDAINIISRILFEIYEKIPDALLVKIETPGDNAGIPNRASATVAVPLAKKLLIKEVKTLFDRILPAELVADKNYTLVMEEDIMYRKALSPQDAMRIVNFLLNMTTMPLRRSEKVHTWILASNTVFCASYMDGSFEAVMNYRVNREEFRESYEVQIKSIASLCGIKREVTAHSPAWSESEDSELRRIALRTYRELFGTDMEEDSCHGVVEVSVLAEKIPGIEIIGTAPYSRGAHTPDEWLDMTTIGPFWEYLKALLKALSER